VTNAQYAAFVQATGYQTQAEKAGKGWVWQDSWQEVKGANWQHPAGPGSDISQKSNHPSVIEAEH
jgi:sulfatase modifying factor 1